MEGIVFKPIGIIHSCYENVAEMPKSSMESLDVEAEMIINEEYLDSMTDIHEGEEYMVIFHFHKSKGFKQQVPLRGDGPITGLFSTHAPNRPNSIGVSNIIIKSVDKNIIKFKGVDMLNNTPVLDIKKIFN